MKQLLLTFAMFFFGFIAVLEADAIIDLQKTPLPAGPLLNRPPDFSQWQILFSYEKSETASNSSGGDAASGLPQRLTVTMTRPLWHAVLEVNGKMNECWFDGIMSYLVESGQPSPIPVGADTADMVPSYLYYRKIDFPDVEWVSPQTYIGSQKEGSILLFQQSSASGAIVWIDASTRYPIRWQKGAEIRAFQFLAPPTESLILPGNIAQLSKEFKLIRDVSSHRPPPGA